MKKILVTILIFLFTATAIGYAGIFKGQSEDNSSDNNSVSYDSSVSNSEEISNEDYGGFFRSSSADDPGGRPGNGGGIGQEAPLSDGLPVLISCCVLLGLLKTFNEKRKKLI